MLQHNATSKTVSIKSFFSLKFVAYHSLKPDVKQEKMRYKFAHLETDDVSAKVSVASCGSLIAC